MERVARDDLALGDLLQAGPEPRRRRGLVLALVGAVVLAALGAGGWAGAGWLRDTDARTALAASATVLQGVAADLDAATGAADLVALSASLDPALERLEAARRGALRQPGGTPAGVAAELTAQRALLEALRPLDGMGSGPLQAWGRVRGPLEQALRDERRTRSTLRRDRPAAAARLADVDRMAPALDALAAPLLERAARAELDRVEQVLRTARTTGDVREAAQVAAAQAPALGRSLAVAPDDASGAALARVGDVVGAVSTLTELSGQDPGPWTAARARLATAVGWPRALGVVDDLVSQAVQAEQAYQREVVAAGAAREADLQALDAHTGTVRGLLSPYGGLDLRLTGLLDALVAARVDAAGLAVFADDVAVRQRLAGGLAALSAPPRAAPPLVAPEHARLVQTTDADAAAVQAVADALAVQAGLAPLPPRPPVPGVDPALPLPALVGQRAEAATQRAAAAAAWQSAALRARTLITTRPLPARPLV